MKVLLLDSAEKVIVDTLAIVLQQRGWEARAVHDSAEAIRSATDSKPDWVFTILNNIVDAKPHDVVLEILRVHPSCKFFLTAGRPMPEFEDKLWESGYALKDIAPLPLHPQDLLDGLTGKGSMVVRAAEGEAPKFIMFRGKSG